MKIECRKFIAIFTLIILFSTACRTEFERIRTSSDADKIYESAVKYFEEEEYVKSQTLLELVLNSFRGSEKSEDLYFKYAYTHYYTNNYLLAAHYFENFSNTFVSSKWREEAEFMKGYSNYLLSPGHRLDQANTQKAIDQFQLFVNTYPNSERVERCNNLIDEMRKKLEQKEYDQGILYFDLKLYNSAVHTFENLLKDFPESKNAEEVRFLILKAAFLLAENSFYERQEERYQEALSKFKDFEKKFPSSSYMAQASTMEQNSRRKLKRFQ
jgi:outer membrane protein assembly factor BamD